MANDIGYSPGAGALIKTDQDLGDSAHVQVVKLAISQAGVSTLIPASAANGMAVDVTRVAGVAQLPGALVGGRLDVNIGASATVPVTVAALPAALVGGRLDVNIGASSATVPVSGTVAVTVAALPGALVGGRLDVNVGAALPVGTNIIGLVKLVDTGGVNVGSISAGGALKVDGSAVTQPVSGTVTVNGTITANQGTAAAAANAWPVKVSDGTDTVGISTVSGAKAIKVDVIQSVGAGALVDEAAYTIGAGKLDVIGGVFKDAAASPADGQVGAARITAFRAIHINIRKNDGTELGIAATPLRVDPTGSTTQPVSGTVTVVLDAATNAGAAAKKVDYDTGAGVDTVTMFGIALPASGGAVIGGTATNPVRTDPTGTTIQPVSGTVAVTVAALPAALVGGRLDVNIGASSATVPVSGTVAVTVAALPGALVGGRLDVNVGAALPVGTNIIGLVKLVDTGGVNVGSISAGGALKVDGSAVTQPVSGTVTVNQGTANATPWNENIAQVNGHTLVEAASGIPKVGISDATGAAFSDANPLPVAIAPRTGKWRVHVALVAAQTDTAVHTPAGGKTVVVEGWTLTALANDSFTLSDGAASNTTDLYKGTPAVGDTVVVNYPRPEPLAAVNNVLRYSTGATTTGDLTVWGYEV